MTEWILESTEFRPLQPDSCIVKDEMDKYEKLWVILMIWLFLVFLAIFYCYFCEQRLFSSQKLFDRSLVDQQGLLTGGRCPNQECNIRNTRSGKHKPGQIFDHLYLQVHSRTKKT